MMVVGASNNPIEVTPVQLIFGNGTFEAGHRHPTDSEDAAACRAEGVRPMIECIPLTKAGDAYARMLSGKAEFRVVLTMLRVKASNGGGPRWRKGSVEMSGRCLEDFAVGRIFLAPVPCRSTRSASRPSPPSSTPSRSISTSTPRDTIFGGLVASGWHTAALTMRLLVENHFSPAGGIVGAGFQGVPLTRPVVPGDELRVEAEVVEVRPSRSRPDQGVLKVRTTTLNHRNEAVQATIGNLVVPRRRP